MQKILVVGLAAVVMATQALAVVIPEGTKEIGLAGSFDNNTAAGNDFALSLKYGMFVMDQIVVGGTFGLKDNDLTSDYELGAYSEYNWDLQTEWVPYVGADLKYGHANPDQGSSADAVVVTPYVGVKYFFSSSVAAYGEFTYNIASEDLYIDEDLNTENTNYGLMVGLRVYLGP